MNFSGGDWEFFSEEQSGNFGRAKWKFRKNIISQMNPNSIDIKPHTMAENEPSSVAEMRSEIEPQMRSKMRSEINPHSISDLFSKK